MEDSNNVEQAKCFSTGSHVDQVFVYAGQTYGVEEFEALKVLNELSRSKKLQLYRKQTSNRNVRILLPSKMCSNQNYENFVHNFNNVALACYLKLLRASRSIWSAYSLDQVQETKTNFSLGKTPSSPSEALNLEALIQDEDFILNYLNAIVRIHNQIVKKLNLVFNKRINKEKCQEQHLYRSFRVLGLRKQKNLFKRKSLSRSSFGNNNFKNSVLVDRDFNDVVDIRGTFDIRQYQDKSTYDCFIECEFSYYNVKSNENQSLNNKFVKFNLNDNFLNCSYKYTDQDLHNIILNRDGMMRL